MIDDGGGLYGDAAQRRSQAAALASEETTKRTPGAVFAARLAGTDDPERFGWDRIDRVLRDEGAITFRMVGTETCREVARRLAELGSTIAWWDVFEGSRDEIAVACDRILAGTRDDLVPLDPPPGGEARFFEGVQEFLAAAGITPFPARVLSGGAGSAALSVLGDPRDRSIVATAFAHFPYNRFSPHHSTAWAGLVAVREDFRGKGFGARVNALTLHRAANDLGALRVHEFARTTNTASCRMIESCGLRLRRDVRSGIAQPSGAASFTR